MMTEFELIRISEEHSPIGLTNLLCEQYYSTYSFCGNSIDATRLVINDFYKMHYGGKDIPNDKVEIIANEYGFNLPLAITCVYLIDIENEVALKQICVDNIAVLFKIINNTHNNTCPINRRGIYVPSNEELNQIKEFFGSDDNRKIKSNNEEMFFNENTINLINSYQKIQYHSEDKSPYILTKLITKLYSEQVGSTFNLDIVFYVVLASSRTILDEKDWFTEEQAFQISKAFTKNVPMIVLCVYFQMHRNSELKLENLYRDRNLIFDIVIDAYNEFDSSNQVIINVLLDEDFKVLVNLLFE